MLFFFTLNAALLARVTSKLNNLQCIDAIYHFSRFGTLPHPISANPTVSHIDNEFTLVLDELTDK